MNSGVTHPQFVLVGVPRAGTTSLYNYLSQHPAVAVSAIKEVNFLAYPGPDAAQRSVPWLRFRVTTIHQYQQQFANAGRRVSIDVSPSCFFSAVSIDRIRQFAPAAQLFVVLRDPVQRAYSAYWNRVRKGYETRAPEEALSLENHVVRRGFYSQRLGQFIDEFGADRLRVWLFDDLINEPTDFMRRMFEYLGVASDHEVDARRVFNAAATPRSGVTRAIQGRPALRRRVRLTLPKRARRVAKRVYQRGLDIPPPIPASVERSLRSLYASDISRVSALIGRDLTAWQEPQSDERPPSAPTPIDE
jgi:hypothetical protein